jgi:hypothetical protein
MRTLYRWDKELQQFVEASQVDTSDQRLTPYVHDDTMAPSWHPADGRMYDSKSAFRRTTRAAGCVEVGNDYQSESRKREYKPLSWKQEIAEAIDGARRRN